MLPISSAELAAIRADIQAAAMDTPCVIKAKTRTSDGGGSSTEVWATTATTVAGITQPSAGLLQNYDFKIGNLSTWQVRLPYGTTVAEQNHLIINGQTLVVQVLLDPRSYPGCVMVLASEVR